MHDQMKEDGNGKQLYIQFTIMTTPKYSLFSLVCMIILVLYRVVCDNCSETHRVRSNRVSHYELSERRSVGEAKTSE